MDLPHLRPLSSHLEVLIAKTYIINLKWLHNDCLVKGRARAAVRLFHLEPNQKGQVSHVGLHTHSLALKGTSVPEFFLNIVQQWSMLKSMQTQSPGAQNCPKQQQTKQVTPLTNLKVSTANVVEDGPAQPGLNPGSNNPGSG